MITTMLADHEILARQKLRGVLRPDGSQRPKITIDRALPAIELERSIQSAPALRHTENSYASRIVFKQRGCVMLLPVASIRWIGAEENYVRIQAENEGFLLREPIGHLQGRLDPRIFMRVHRSWIVNLQFVKELRTERTGKSAVVLSSGDRLSMSRSCKAKMKDWLVHCAEIASGHNVLL